MRPSLLVSLLLLSLLLHKTEAIRFDKGLFMQLLGHQKIQEHKSSSLKIQENNINGGVIADVIPYKEGHCRSGMNRKLVTIPTSSTTTTTTTTSKNEKISGGNNDNNALKGGSGEEPTINFSSSPVSDHHPEATHDHYVDMMDIAEMDYSPAKRKPPIHN